MANLFALKIRQPFFLWTIIFCCLLPFVILAFFSFMALDDYYFVFLYRNYSFSEAQAMTYLGWDGRFFSSFLKGVFVKAGIVSQYYFIAVLLLFSFTWWSLFLLLKTINKYLLAQTFSKAAIIQASFVLFLVEIYTMADIASGIYWFSSAIVYQPAFIFFVLLVNCLIRRLYTPSPGNTLLKDSAIVFLILAIFGCNEIAAIFLTLFLLVLLTFDYLYKHRLSRPLFIYLVIAVLTGIFIITTSGVISERHNEMNKHTSYLAILPIILFRAVSVFYYILKEPLFWITALFSLIAGIKAGQIPVVMNRLSFFKGRRILVPVLLLLVVGTLTPVLLVSKGSLPARSLNNIISLTTPCLLTLSFLAGFSYTSLFRSFTHIPSSIAIIILACGMMASTNYLEAWKSVFTGYFYHAIMEDRERLMLEAKEKPQKVAVIRTYKEALKAKINRAFPNGTFVTVNELLMEPPKLLLYCNEVENSSRAYLIYYGLDKIIIDSSSLYK